MIILILSFSSICTTLRAWMFNSASERVVARLRKDLFSHLMNQVSNNCLFISCIMLYPSNEYLSDLLILLCQEIAFYDVTRTGELLSRLSEDTQIIKNAATTNLSEALRNLTTTFIGLGFMFSTSWKLTRKFFKCLIIKNCCFLLNNHIIISYHNNCN